MLLRVISRSVLRCLTNLELLRPISVPSSFPGLRTLSTQASQESPAPREPIRASETAEEVEQSTADIPYEELLKALMPSEKVYKTISSEHHEKLKEIIKELEIFAYMGNIVPKSLTDDHWYR
ncbi:unnamed protein product [Haemonchus placei]|uniref:28S ribosomal protein S22, mitochondrial n=1 Tax=Haemonchus placei TaxID=6290 RepID=A0A0N4XC09_HAEPC|nr:unnamed protein product [Haemonchus placei]